MQDFFFYYNFRSLLPQRAPCREFSALRRCIELFASRIRKEEEKNSFPPTLHAHSKSIPQGLIFSRAFFLETSWSSPDAREVNVPMTRPQQKNTADALRQEAQRGGGTNISAACQTQGRAPKECCCCCYAPLLSRQVGLLPLGAIRT